MAGYAEGLTPYSTAFRYPGEALAPSANEFQKALQGAEGLYAFVLSTLPRDVCP